MTDRRMLPIVLLIAAVASGAWSGISWRRAGVSLHGIDGKRAAAVAERDTTRTVLQKTSLLYQGFLNSMSDVPDSVRTYGGGIIMEQQKIYQKKLNGYEVAERDLTVKIERLDRERAEVVAARRQSALPGAIAAVLLLGAAGAVVRRKGSRAVAA
jgi:hypothetical protein